VSTVLRVNPIACTGHALCAELIPEHIALDPWGYPIVPKSPVPEDLVGLARKAVAACPALALLIERRED
jgi:ferredoxin